MILTIFIPYSILFKRIEHARALFKGEEVFEIALFHPLVAH